MGPLRRAVIVLATVGTATLGIVLTGCTSGNDTESQVRSAAQSYLTAWSKGDYRAAAERTDDPQVSSTLLTQTGADLGVPGPSARIAKVAVTDTGAEVDVRVSWPLPAAPPWEYGVPLELVQQQDGHWLVHVTPAVVHPDLQAGEGLSVTRSLPERATILDASGNPVFAATPVVTVGVDPGKVTDLPALADTLAQVLQVDAAQVVSDVQAGTPGQLVPVITLRRTDYDAVRDQIYDLPGTVFSEATRQLAPTSQFARAVLGRVGPVTQEIIDEADGRFVAGDEVGLTGLQRGYQSQLAGTAGFTVSATKDGAPVRELGSVAPVPGKPLQTTLDSTVQSTADEAVNTLAQPSYIVVLRPSTGDILAVSSNAAATATNALTGQYPAGSTFKIITASAVLAAGLAAPTTTVGCPASTTVQGKEFENEDRFDLGEVSLQTAFAQSCNSTFTALGIQLPASALPDTAARFGIGTHWSLPVETFSGSLPVPADPVVQAADSIGQGEVLVSPFAMALVAATAANGSTPVPVLVPEEKPAGQAPAPPSSAVLDALRPMLRQVVLDGTATALGSVPGEVFGKTGTAEYGTGNPPPAHAWFVGYRGDLAFAVFVEGGQSSGTTAVPLAETFLRALPAS